MQDLISYIARWIVDDPEAVEVRTFRRGDRMLVRLNVADEDMGRVIGKDGRIASAMRTLLHTSGELRGRDTGLEIR